MESIYSESYKRMADVFEQCEIAQLKFKNRILRSATNDYSGSGDGRITETQVALYQKLAEKGVAGIITANFYVNVQGKLDRNQNAINADYDLQGITRLAEAVHGTDTKIIMQISHAGAKSKVNAGAAARYYREVESRRGQQMLKLQSVFSVISAKWKKVCVLHKPVK